MQVKLESGVAQRDSLAHKWDTEARKQFAWFEKKRMEAKATVQGLRASAMTNWKDPIQYYHRFMEQDLL